MPDLDLDSLFLSKLKGDPNDTVAPVTTAQQEDLDAMFLNRLKPSSGDSSTTPTVPVPAAPASPVTLDLGSAGNSTPGATRVIINGKSGTGTDALPETVGAPQSLVDSSWTQPSDWNLGHSIAYGMSQGWTPEILAKVRSLTGGGKYEDELKKVNDAHDDYRKENSGKDLLGTIAGSTATAIPMMMAGQEYAAAPLANMVSRAAPAVAPLVDFLAGAGKGLSTIPSWMARGGIEGVGNAALQSHMGTESVPDQLQSGGVMGALLGPVGSYLSNKLGSKVNPVVAQNALDLLDVAGPGAVRAGQVPGASPITSKLDQWFNKAKTPAQLEQFNTALTRQAGHPSPHIDQNWVSTADARNGATMNGIVNRHSIPYMEPQLNIDLHDIRQAVPTSLSPEGQARAARLLDQIDHEILTGPISGQTYRNWTMGGQGSQAKGLLWNNTHTPDFEYNRFVNDHVRAALDDAWGRALGPAQKDAWDTARQQYKNTRIIDSKIDPATGEFDPRKLLKPVEQKYGNVNNAGDMGTLAKGGQFVHPEGGGQVSSHSHGARNAAIGAATIGTGLGVGGSHVVLEHGGDIMHSVMANPGEMAVPLALMLMGGGAAKGAASYLNSPRSTRAMLEAALTQKGRSVAPWMPTATYVSSPRK